MRMYWKEINWQTYEIGNEHEAGRVINERRMDSVNISPSGTGRAAFTTDKSMLRFIKSYSVPMKSDTVISRQNKGRESSGN